MNERDHRAAACFLFASACIMIGLCILIGWPMVFFCLAILLFFLGVAQ